MSSNTITRNDLKNILNEVLPENSNAIYKILYDSSKLSSGTLTLSEPYTNFDYLVVSYLVNVDSFSKTFDCATIAANPSKFYHGSIALHNGSAWYASSCLFTITDSTHLAVQNYGNNSNFIAGITKIVGVKNPSIPADTINLNDYVIEQGTAQTTNSTLSGPINWIYRKWNSGVAECWGTANVASRQYAASGGYYGITFPYPPNLFTTNPSCLEVTGGITTVVQTDIGFTANNGADSGQTYLINRNASAVTNTAWAFIHALGTWK